MRTIAFGYVMNATAVGNDGPVERSDSYGRIEPTEADQVIDAALQMPRILGSDRFTADQPCGTVAMDGKIR